MQRPRPIAGWCPHYDHPSDRCYLTESQPYDGSRESKCKSDQGCKHCGNYEAWASGYKYQGK